ncbi:MAG: peptidyl-prolyl cis-trans isomerase [Armatimonadota bacterium]
MSISTVREKFFEGGCGKSVLLFSAIAMVVTMGYSACGRSAKFAATDAKGQKLATFATVGGVELPVAWVDKAQEQLIQQQLGGNAQLLDQLPPTFAVSLQTQAVTQVIEQGYMLEAALQSGIKIDEESIKKEITLDKFKKSIRDQLGTQLKPNATDAELDTKVKELAQGQTVADLYKKQMDEFTKKLADPAEKPLLQAQFGPAAAVEQIKNSLKPDEAAVKESFKQFDVKRILIKGADQAKAKKIYDEIKAGKTFESAMDQYSDEVAEAGKKKSDRIMPVPMTAIQRSEDLKPIGSLTPNGYTEPVKTPDGLSIFKVIAIKANVPPDFDKEKARYMTQWASSEAQGQFQKKIDELKKSTLPKFELKAYEAAYALGKGMMEAADKISPEIQKAYDLAKGVSKDEPGAELAATVALAAFQKIYDAPGADKAKLKAERIASLTKFLEFKDNWDLRKEVITDLKDQKKGDDAYNQLLIALDKNNKYDANGQRIYSDVAASFKELQAATLVKAEQEKEFRGRQEEWQKAKADYDKTEAELAKQQKEEEAKQKAAQPKAPTTPPSSSAPKK